MIRYVTGDIFASDALALVNPVNCGGVMGKGLAAEFKRRWPENFEAYRVACKAGRVAIGKSFVMSTFRAGEGRRVIVNLPTKIHWRDPSRLEWIVAGLADLRRVIDDRAIRSIAMPALGCGPGGLAWEDVRREIEDILGQDELMGIKIEVYPP